ncbi:branched-chain amino acid transport system II carrier protein [Clostridium aminobutyricum]|uniref:Branched-chain amino acid transport system carrier protein n=1 Tax=Clostridium aminobutyricum TaxID=33953 RepID=A0A939D7Y3_CLOAM|nr:branched-chain amino acid transport system II carrier protein [Clostridium aminobutyricum]MBN7772463.1 branched-chain amino acid transport system II carrier protein [Clostridium aminobutyricum]
MIKENRIYKDIFILGLALFSMFFGAGSIIFPPYLGLISGSSWLSSFSAYFIADFGFAVLALFAILKTGGDVELITGKMGKIPGILLTSTIILCIGPLLAIPRTGATTYEMSVKVLFGDSTTLSVITSIVYFGIILLMTLHESAVVDIIGKYLTPILFIGLMAVIIKGIITPIGPIAQEPLINDVIKEGISAGYQTMDVLAALAFGIIIIKTVAQKGYHKDSEKRKIVASASLVAAAGMFIIFFGLAYLGATTSTLYGIEIGRAELLTNIIQNLMGNGGNILLGIVVFLACLTTGAALTSTTAEYFSSLSKGKVGYKTLIVIICIFSAIITNSGLDFIISFAGPILNIVYPAAIVLIILAFFHNYIRNIYVYRFAVLAAMIVNIMEILESAGKINFSIAWLPFSQYNFPWIVPAIVCGFLGALVPGTGLKNKN